MDGWSKIAAGVALGIAGTVYATNRKVREKLPDAARDLPDSVKRRFDDAVSAAKEASASRREEILNDLSRHQAQHPPPHPGRPEAVSGNSGDFVVENGTGGGIFKDEPKKDVITDESANVPRGETR